jgi:hypothetical protein
MRGWLVYAWLPHDRSGWLKWGNPLFWLMVVRAARGAAASAPA